MSSASDKQDAQWQKPDKELGKVYDHGLVRRLWPFIKPHWRPLIGALLLLPVSAGLMLVPPYLLKRIIDDAIVPRDLQLLPMLGGILVVVLVLQHAASFAHTLMIQVCGQHTMHDLRVHTHRHLLSLRASFFDRVPVGKLMTRVTNDIESIAEAFASGVLALFGDLLKVIGIIATMLWLDAKLTLLTFAVLPFLLLIVIFFQRLLRRTYRDIRKRMAHINGTLQELISGMKIVTIFGRARRVEGDFDKVNRAYRDSYKRAIGFDAALFALVEMLGTITVACLLWYGGGQVVKGFVSFGLLVAFIEYVHRFFEPVRDLSAKYAVMQQAMAAAERVVGLLDTDAPDCPDDAEKREPNGAAEGGPQHATLAPPKVVFEDIRFAYEGQSALFDQLTVEVNRGETVALVGPTGSGKTSLARLLTRLYEPSAGRVLLDGVDVRELPREALRRRVVVLGQDVFLYAGSVRENITLGDPDISEQQVTAASKRVGLDKRLELDAEVGERGQRLSQGERQLVVLARALARDPEVLVMDEATASVDPETELLIQAGIAEVMRGRTAIVIAHRLSTIEATDRVIVLRQGRVVEQGSHDELLAADGLYAALQRLQLVEA
jgi:ATP-binding cassette subfamily B multidrug efflux pump